MYDVTYCHSDRYFILQSLSRLNPKVETWALMFGGIRLSELFFFYYCNINSELIIHCAL